MRKPRIIVSGASYHVCARANRQELILENEQIKLLFLDVLKKAKKKYNFIFTNFCIMGNHIHLEIKPQDKISISRIMQWILSVFALQYNKIYTYKGHVWYDRFKSKVIETLQQLVNTFLYIANNPVRAGLVDHPLKFIYNGIHFHKNGPPWPAYKNLLDPLTDAVLREALDYHLAVYNQEQHNKYNEMLSFRTNQ